MELVNLTPHRLNIHTDGGLRVLPSDGLARVASVNTDADPIEDIPTVRTTRGEVTGLPDPIDGVIYIVSGMVASAAPRADVFSPGDLVRDDSGRPIGCKGLRRSV
jgi:hypothetical protein